MKCVEITSLSLFKTQAIRTVKANRKFFLNDSEYENILKVIEATTNEDINSIYE